MIKILITSAALHDVYKNAKVRTSVTSSWSGSIHLSFETKLSRSLKRGKARHPFVMTAGLETCRLKLPVFTAAQKRSGDSALPGRPVGGGNGTAPEERSESSGSFC